MNDSIWTTYFRDTLYINSGKTKEKKQLKILNVRVILGSNVFSLLN